VSPFTTHSRQRCRERAPGVDVADLGETEDGDCHCTRPRSRCSSPMGPIGDPARRPLRAAAPLPLRPPARRPGAPTNSEHVRATLRGIRRTVGAAPARKAPVLAEAARQDSCEFLRPFGRRGQEHGYVRHRYVRRPWSQEAAHDRDFHRRETHSKDCSMHRTRSPMARVASFGWRRFRLRPPGPAYSTYSLVFGPIATLLFPAIPLASPCSLL
jgi:hypothetical protein